MTNESQTLPEQAEPDLIGTLLSVCARLNISDNQLAKMMSMDNSFVSNLRLGKAVLEDGTEPYDVAQKIVTTYRLLDKIIAGQKAAADRWIGISHMRIAGKRIDFDFSTVELATVVAYLASIES